MAAVIRPLVAVVSALLLVSACGGGQSAQSDPSPPPAPEPAAEAEPTPPEPPQPEHYYDVYWRDIHVLTVYPDPGPVRSEEPDNPDDTFSSRSDFMSAVSHYVEQEPEMGRIIARATSLDDLLEQLRADGYDVVEELLERGL